MASTTRTWSGWRFSRPRVDAIYQPMKPLQEAAPEERAAEGRRRGGLIRQDSLRQNLPEAAGAVQKGRVRDKIGAFAGLSGRTVERIRRPARRQVSADGEAPSLGNPADSAKRRGQLPAHRVSVLVVDNLAHRIHSFAYAAANMTLGLL
jgi:hypothetical protein